MHPERLRQLAQWLAATDIGLLELRTPDETVRLGRDGAGPGGIVQLEAQAEGEESEPQTVTAEAASVGVFLHTHPLAAAPLARIGERVAAGQPVGLLRIGPLLLPVGAPRDGVMLSMRVAHGDAVGYGTPLVDLQPL